MGCRRSSLIFILMFNGVLPAVVKVLVNHSLYNFQVYFVVYKLTDVNVTSKMMTFPLKNVLEVAGYYLPSVSDHYDERILHFSIPLTKRG